MSAIQQLFGGTRGVVVPANTVAPVVSGTATVAQVLSCTTGSWSGPPTSYSYQWQQGTTNISGATSSTYTIDPAYVGVTIRCVVTATNSLGSTSANSNSTAAVSAITGQVAYTSPGTYSWTCPANVTSVSVVCVGPGSHTYAGGGLGWKNNISVTPGNTYTVQVGQTSADESTTVKCSYFLSQATVRGNSGGNVGTTDGSPGSGGFLGTGGGNGGTTSSSQGGGGAGGYAGNGGSGGSAYGGNGSAGAGGAGGGGAAYDDGANFGSAPGGGVGLLGQGSSGTGGTKFTSAANGGGGGSGGTAGGNTPPYSPATVAGAYGGGGGGFGNTTTGAGAVRIIWPGTTRQFPSTNTTDM